MLTFESFLLAQPCAPEEKSSDRFYFDVALRLVEKAKEIVGGAPVHEALVERAALCVIGYYQDMIADAGLWHGFSDECRRLYGTPVPFFKVSEDYVDYELNREDVGFLVWYAFAMYSDDRRVYPFDSLLVSIADAWHEILESVYEDAPVPEGYHLAHELDVYAEEDREMILRLGSWLYLHSWLLRPAFAYSSAAIISEMRSAGKSDDEIADALQNTMQNEPTGPLALFLGEWVHLTVKHSLPGLRQRQEEQSVHPAFERLTAETGGAPVRFIDGYDALNDYLISVLGWKPGVEHLTQLKNCRDFVLMVNPHKGLLIAPDICRCVNAPSNPLYDKAFAESHAIDLLTERGVCPHDLLAFICENGWLTDARFPGSDDTSLPSEYHDFIARCYLQLYYRGD